MPSSSTFPLVGVSNPASSPSSVVFPEPDAPMIATASLGEMERSMPSRIVSRLRPVSTCLPSDSARTMSFVSVMRSLFGLVLFCALATAGAFAQAQAPVILVVGDSLSAGYGLPQGRGWVNLLQQRLIDRKLDYRVVNASISGDTTAGGRARLPAALDQYRPAIVIIELGANDGLRGQPIESMRENLTEMVGASR